MPRGTTKSNKSSHNSITPLPNSLASIQIQQPGFFSIMWQGFGLGAGQSIAHNIFRSDPVVKHIHSSESNSKEYDQCMKESNNDKEACKQYLEK
jgi:hypothetical protein